MIAQEVVRTKRTPLTIEALAVIAAALSPTVCFASFGPHARISDVIAPAAADAAAVLPNFAEQHPAAMDAVIKGAIGFKDKDEKGHTGDQLPSPADYIRNDLSDLKGYEFDYNNVKFNSKFKPPIAAQGD